MHEINAMTNKYLKENCMSLGGEEGAEFNFLAVARSELVCHWLISPNFQFRAKKNLSSFMTLVRSAQSQLIIETN